MAVTASLYGLALQSALNGEIDFDTDTIKVMLCGSSYTPLQDTHRYKSSVTGEVTGTGYTAGGLPLSSKTVTYASGSNTLTLDAADVTWPASSITARYAVIYKDTGTAATSPLICFVDFGEEITSAGAAFLISWDAAGIVALTAA